MTRSERWTAQADAWATWADAGHEDDVLPLFYDLLPHSRRRTLDLGCGEGRIARELSARGHTVVGVDVAPSLVELARRRDERGDYRVAAAERLPFDEGTFDLVVAFNVLMNVDDPARAVEEAARVLTTGGRVCASIVHPIASSGAWDGDVFCVRDYMGARGRTKSASAGSCSQTCTTRSRRGRAGSRRPASPSRRFERCRVQDFAAGTACRCSSSCGP